MIKKIYYFLHSKFSRSDERGEYSAGHWQNMIREEILNRTKVVDGSLLEVGCGEGLFLSALAERNKKIKLHGIDIWDKILERAEERFKNEKIEGIELKQADATNLPFEDNYFNAVVCMNVLFNLPTDEMCYKTLDEMIRVCSKGGKIVLDIRNSLNPLLWVKYKLAPFYDETVKDLPLRTYHLKPLLEYLNERGVVIKDVVPVGFPKNMFAPLFVIEGELE